MPNQLDYGGKTDRCHPNYQFPLDWDIIHSGIHWSNELTMLQYILYVQYIMVLYYIIITVYYIIWYIETVIVPYVTRVHSELKNEKQAALTIFDCLKSQLTKEPPMLWKTTIYPQ